MHLNEHGTKGRGTPVEMSQRIVVFEAVRGTFSSLREGEDLTVAKSGSSV